MMDGYGASRRRVSATLPFLGVLVLTFNTIASTTWAQTVASGTIHGTVKDESGGTLPGVTVTLTSPVLQVGHLVMVTDSAGDYRFPNLPAGTYGAAFELTGFARVIREELRLTVGFVALVDVQMKVGRVEESVTVSGQSPVVDTTQTGAAVTLTKEALDSTPRGGGLADVYVMSPGVTTAGAPDVGDSNLASNKSVQSYGLAANPKLEVEGINITDSGSTASASYTTAFPYGEMLIKASGNDPEVSTPGILLVAQLKSGGNTFHGTYQGAFETPQLQSSNLTPQLQAQGLSFTNPIKHYYDVAADLGGAIVRDKLWFYEAWNRQALSTGLLGFAAAPGPDGTYLTADDVPGVFDTNLTSQTTKLSYQLSKSNRLIMAWMHDTKRQPEYAADRLRVLESTRNYVEPIDVYKGEIQSAISDRLLLNVVGGDAGYFADYRSNYATPGHPPAMDIATGLHTGSNESLNQQPENRYQLNDSLSYFPERFLGGHHELKVGTEVYWDFDGLGKLSNPAGNYLLYYNVGVPFKIDIYNYPIQPHDKETIYAAYVKDTWRIREGLTVNFGVRWQRQNVSLPAQSVGASPEFPTLYPSASFPQRNIQTWASTVPRVGVAWSLNPRTVVKATFGVYNSELGFTFSDAYTQNATTTTTFKWTDPTHANDYVPGTVNLNLNGPDFISVSGAANNRVNPNLQQPMTTEATGSFERELRENLGLHAVYVFRRQTNNYDSAGWNVARPYSAYDIPVTRQDPGPDGKLGTADDGGLITFYDYDPAYKGAAFVQNERINTSTSGDWYHAIEFGMTKRASARGSAIVSMTIVKNHRWITNTFDSPNANVFPLDETWTESATVSANYRLPGDIQVSGFMQNKTGVLGQRTYTFTGISQLNTLSVRMEPYGAEKGLAINILDLRVGKRFSMGRSRSLEVDFNVFNALNSNAPTAINFTSGPTFGYYTSIVPPRVARLGARFNF
jgi:carboxypeptidase family protein